MIQLEPREIFTIARQLPDHTDATTYYVRAEIRNAKTDALIERVALTDRGSRRFSNTWQVIPDTSGLGTYISIVTEVYTDSGYTTKGGYGDDMNVYLVQERNRNLGGGGGSNIDYKKIRKIVSEEVEKEVAKVENMIPAPKKVSLEPIVEALEDLKREVRRIDIPELDLSEALKRIDTSTQAIVERIGMVRIPEIPEQKETDLSPVIHRLDGLQIDSLRDTAQETVTELKEAISSLAAFIEKTPDYQKHMAENSGAKEKEEKQNAFMKRAMKLRGATLQEIPQVKAKAPDRFMMRAKNLRKV